MGRSRPSGRRIGQDRDPAELVGQGAVGERWHRSDRNRNGSGNATRPAGNGPGSDARTRSESELLPKRAGQRRVSGGSPSRPRWSRPASTGRRCSTASARSARRDGASPPPCPSAAIDSATDRSKRRDWVVDSRSAIVGGRYLPPTRVEGPALAGRPRPDEMPPHEPAPEPRSGPRPTKADARLSRVPAIRAARRPTVRQPSDGIAPAARSRRWIAARWRERLGWTKPVLRALRTRVRRTWRKIAPRDRGRGPARTRWHVDARPKQRIDGAP